MLKSRACLLTAALLLTASSVLGASEIERGRELFRACAVCHGEQGQGDRTANAPVIAGRAEWYIVRQLNKFREGIRAHPMDKAGAQMRLMALSLEDEQAIIDVASYVASLRVDNPATTLQGNIAVGREAFALCEPCHGSGGEGNGRLNAPRLSNQYDWYIARQLSNFKAGIRGPHTKDIYGNQMRPMAQLLGTPEQVNDVAAYIATLPWHEDVGGDALATGAD